MAPTQCGESVGNFKKQLTTFSLNALNLPRQSTCIQSHNKAAAYLHWTICKHYNIKVQDKFYEQEPATVTENQTATILLDMLIQIDKEIKKRKQTRRTGERQGGENPSAHRNGYRHRKEHLLENSQKNSRKYKDLGE